VIFDNVSMAFEENVVLNGVSFHLPRGETKALFGVAGSGKSTILKLTLGLMKPDGGRIFLSGKSHEHVRTGVVRTAQARGDCLSGKRTVRFAQSAGKRRLPIDGRTPL